MKKQKEIEKIKLEIKKEAKQVELFSFLRLISFCIAAFLIIMTFIFRPVYIEGDSMYPTLENHDIGITNIISRIAGGVDRFDVVMAFDKQEEKYLAKRVIGLPGETIQYRDDVLYVDGKLVSEPFLNTQYKKEQTNNGQIKFTDNFGPVKLKENEYFLLGDNRRISKDSRAIGAVHADDIISKNIFIIYPWK